MLRWIIKGAKTLSETTKGARADDIVSGVGKASQTVKEAPLRATVAAGNMLASSKAKRQIMVERALGRTFSEAIEDRAGDRIAVTTADARTAGKLVSKALDKGCDALVISAEKLGAAKNAKDGAKLTLCAIEGKRQSGKRQAAQDAAQTLEALTKGRTGADVGVFRGQNTWMETPGPRASLADWLQTVAPYARVTTGLGGALAWVGLGRDNPEGTPTGGMNTSASEGMNPAGASVEPQETGITSDLQAAEPSSEVTMDRSPGTTADGKKVSELREKIAKILTEKAEVETELAALRSAAKDTAGASAIGMSLVKQSEPRRGQRALSTSGPSTKAPERPPRKRKPQERER